MMDMDHSHETLPRDYALCRYCGKRIELTDEQIARWRTMNALARKRGQPLLAPNEIWPCPRPSSCYNKWYVELRDRGMTSYRRDRAEAAQRELPLSSIDELS